MRLGWLAAILTFEWIAYAFLTRNWHRAARLQLAKTADMFVAMPDLAAFIAVHVVAAGLGLLLAWRASGWLAKILVFVAVFWFTAKLLRFISLLVVVRYAGIAPAHVLRMVPTPEAQRDQTVALRAESLRLMEQLALDELWIPMMVMDNSDLIVMDVSEPE